MCETRMCYLEMKHTIENNRKITGIRKLFWPQQMLLDHRFLTGYYFATWKHLKSLMFQSGKQYRPDCHQLHQHWTNHLVGQLFYLLPGSYWSATAYDTHMLHLLWTWSLSQPPNNYLDWIRQTMKVLCCRLKLQIKLSIIKLCRFTSTSIHGIQNNEDLNMVLHSECQRLKLYFQRIENNSCHMNGSKWYIIFMLLCVSTYTSIAADSCSIYRVFQ